ncbi:hypothetical protein AURDEDRAFT_66901, partial [Auricularia subglabra TFB-10046 SS5]
QFPWPEGVTPIERVLLSANGDLQRLLSAFFAKPIDAQVLSTATSFADSGTRALPMTQKRVILLLCDRAVVCKATSTVVAKSDRAVDLLEQGFFLGQVLRTLQQIPNFALRDVRLWTDESAKRVLARRYTVSVDSLECDIEEEFLDRNMFSC